MTAVLEKIMAVRLGDLPNAPQKQGHQTKDICGHLRRTGSREFPKNGRSLMYEHSGITSETESSELCKSGTGSSE